MWLLLCQRASFVAAALWCSACVVAGGSACLHAARLRPCMKVAGGRLRAGDEGGLGVATKQVQLLTKGQAAGGQQASSAGGSSDLASLCMWSFAALVRCRHTSAGVPPRPLQLLCAPWRR